MLGHRCGSAPRAGDRSSPRAPCDVVSKARDTSEAVFSVLHAAGAGGPHTACRGGLGAPPAGAWLPAAGKDRAPSAPPRAPGVRASGPLRAAAGAGTQGHAVARAVLVPVAESHSSSPPAMAFPRPEPKSRVIQRNDTCSGADRFTATGPSDRPREAGGDTGGAGSPPQRLAKRGSVPKARLAPAAPGGSAGTRGGGLCPLLCLAGLVPRHPRSRAGPEPGCVPRPGQHVMSWGPRLT